MHGSHAPLTRSLVVDALAVERICIIGCSYHSCMPRLAVVVRRARALERIQGPGHDSCSVRLDIRIFTDVSASPKVVVILCVVAKKLSKMNTF